MAAGNVSQNSACNMLQFKNVLENNINVVLKNKTVI